MDDKIFDLKKVKVKAIAKTIKPEDEKSSPIKLHAKFFDWHTLAILLYALAIILGFVAAALLTRYLVVKQQSDKNAPQATQEKIVETNVTVTPDETNKANANPFAPPETPTTTTSEVDKKAVKIRVLNGNGVTGDAAKAKKQLEDTGLSVSSTGNAKRLDYSKTQVYYLAGKKAQGEAVEKALKDAGRETQLEEASSDLVGKDTEVLVVTGRK